MEVLLENAQSLLQGDGWKLIVMWLIGAVLIYLAIAKDMEPSLLLPIGFGAILMNLPGADLEILHLLYEKGIANELFPLILFIGIGAMIDFGPLLSNPKLMIFGAAAQFGIFFTFFVASLCGFDIRDAASIAIIGAADGPTSIVVANALQSGYIGAITVAAYSYMALVPIVQPPVIRLLTTKKERLIRMPYEPKQISKTTRILFPIVITIITGIFAPKAVALVGFLMFGNLIRECGVLNSLSETAQKFLNLFLPKGRKINPMIGAAGISAFPMSSRVIHKMGLKEDPQNFLLMHTVGVNVSGQIASVIAGGLIMSLVYTIG